MGLIAAKCSECGAPIEVDDTRKFGFCPNCGTKYVTQDVVQNFQQNYYTINQNKIENAVFQGGDTERTYFERFDAFRRLGQLAQAGDVAEQMRKKFPQKAITWYCSLYHAYALSFRVFDDLVQRQIPNARGKMEHIFDTKEAKQKVEQWFAKYKRNFSEIEKQLRSFTDVKKRSPMEGGIVVYPEGDKPVPCEAYVRGMEERAAMFETEEDRGQYAPFLERLAQEKEEFARRLEETKGALREFNAEYHRTAEAWECRVMADFRSMKNWGTARKAVAWTFGLIFFALFVSIFIAAIVTL